MLSKVAHATQFVKGSKICTEVKMGSKAAGGQTKEFCQHNSTMLNEVKRRRPSDTTVFQHKNLTPYILKTISFTLPVQTLHPPHFQTY